MDSTFDSDCDGDDSLLEPQVILGDQNMEKNRMLKIELDERFSPHDEDDSYMSGTNDSSFVGNEDERCHVCSESLDLHFAGLPCDAYEEGDSSGDGIHSTTEIQICPVCNGKNPSREHLANHFMQELSEGIEGESECPKCEFRVANTSRASVKNQTKILALHHVTEHGGEELNELLNDPSLVALKKSEFQSRRSSFSGVIGSGQRLTLPQNCPICDQQLHKQHSRDHVSWHFMDELRMLIKDPSKCPECSYTGDKPEAVSRHLALFHCKLDEFLKDLDLVAEKRAKAMSKPKKVTIGPSCVICGLKDPPREHVSRHFMKELMEIISELPDPMQCPECNYRGEKAQNLARHVALVHSKLDELLADEGLVELRRQEQMAKPNKINIGEICPVCDQRLTKQHSRVHVIWHFIEELRAIVNTFTDTTCCEYCEYTNNNSDKVVKHIALGHSKLDEMLSDEDLLQKKRALAQSKPKKLSIGPNCPVCDVRDPPREHVARHFGDELAEYVAQLPDQQQCSQCNYKGERAKNLGLHVALVHGQLDLYLDNDELVRAKRNKFLSLPKKQVIGPTCPICDLVFTKSQNRDHVAWHFMEELREFVLTFSNPQACWQCEYTSEKMDNLVKHIALGHSKLDELLSDAELVAQKRAKAMSRPKKVTIVECPICDVKEPAREHVSRHFSEELMAIVSEFPDPTACVECEYKSDKPKTLSIHVALVHGKLDMFLLNDELVALKRESFLSKPKKLIIGPTCPVCSIKFTKSQNRDHVAWHYMDELRAIVQEFNDPNQCPQCPYSSDTNEKMVKHVALGHSMLDTLLQDEELLEQKRLKAMSKPRKVSIGLTCPVCDVKEPSREHVSRHFSDELLNIVMEFEDPLKCSECNYKSEKAKNVAIHIALVHAILDHFLSNESLVKEKRDAFFNKPQKVNVGSQCPICDIGFSKGTNRDHISWHFMEELREYVLDFPDTQACNECTYTSDKLDNLAKHVALGHSRIDILLQNEALVAQKREIVMNKPKKISIGPTCPICDIKFTKQQNRDHVAWHFMDEFREFVQQTGSDKACQLCSYTTDKNDNLLKHYALGHSKLDELLQDEALVAKKREIHQQKPKRLSLGPDCVVCGAKGRDRDHMARHYMTELMELVNSLPSKNNCNMCEYKNQRQECLAKHLALFHCKLDELLLDEDLLKEKRAKYSNLPQRVPIGDACVICKTTLVSREHVCRHFQPELMAIVNAFTSPLSCGMCEFSATKAEYIARHVGLVHLKLDEFLQDSQLVAKKIQEYEATINSKISPMALSNLRKSHRKFLDTSGSVKTEDESDGGWSPLKRNASSTSLTPSPSKQVSPIKRLKSEMKEEDAMDTDPDDLPLRRLKHIKKEATDGPLKSPDKNNCATGIKSASTQKSLQLPPSITLTPAGSKASPVSGLFKRSRPDPKVIEDVNNSWAQSLMKKSKRTRLSSPVKGELGSSTPVTLQQVSGHTRSMAKQPTVAVNGTKTEIPQPAKVESSYQQIKQEEDMCDENGGSLFEPQVIIDTSALGSTNDEIDANVDQEFPVEFCDVCSMELINHGDELPCEPTEDYFKLHKFCKICDIREPTREHVSRHFLTELLEVVECFQNPLSCTQCDYQADVSETVALHIALVHSQVDEYLEDDDLVKLKRQKFKTKIQKFELGETCPVCDQALNRLYKRDHVIWHFMDDLKEIVQAIVSFDGIAYRCRDCDHFTDKLENMARHLGLSHNKLDLYLNDAELLQQKRQKVSTIRPIRRDSIQLCPICDVKEPSREHISRHFMSELLEHVATLPDQFACARCTYKGERPQNLAKHIALVHSKLDEFLSNTDLVKVRREEIMSKPKKISIGSVCPVCSQGIAKRDSRVHVIWHFMEELREIVQQFDDTQKCQLCPYTNQNVDKMAKHMALGHSKLDELLSNEEMLKMKREKASAKPKKLSIGQSCPICGIQFAKKHPNRDHVLWHFMDELRDYVLTFDNTKECNQCTYTSDKLDNLVKHVGLGHSKLDELLQNKELVETKKALAEARPKKLVIGPMCPICDITFSKGQSRDHVCWHFMDELREIVNSFPDPRSCTLCEYTSEKIEGLVKHIGLGHSKLDEFLQDKELVARKRNMIKSKAKRSNVAPICPICFSVSPTREHLAMHFMEDLLDFVEDAMDGKLNCDKCKFRCDSAEKLAMHLGLQHGKLDEYLSNANFVSNKRAIYNTKKTPKAATSTSQVQCLVCDALMARPELRKHCAEHFSEEMDDVITQTFDSPNQCKICIEGGAIYQTSVRETMRMHIALAHSKLEELLADDIILENKREAILDKKNGSKSIKPSVEAMDVDDDDDDDLGSLVEEESDLEENDEITIKDEDFEDIIYEEEEEEIDSDELNE